MTQKRTKQSADPTPYAGQAAPERKIIPAEQLGLSLTISDKTLKEFERINDEKLKHLAKARNFLFD